MLQYRSLVVSFWIASNASANAILDAAARRHQEGTHVFGYAAPAFRQFLGSPCLKTEYFLTTNLFHQLLGTLKRSVPLKFMPVTR